MSECKIFTGSRLIDIDRDILIQYFQEGRDHTNWYEDNLKFIKWLFGYDWELVITLLAATSQRTQLSANVTQTLKILYRIQEGLDIMGDNEEPDFLPAMVIQIEKTMRGEDFAGRKIESFKRNMLGDNKPVVCDMWVAKACGLIPTERNGKKYYNVTDKQYTQIEDYITELAKELQVEPRDFQSAVWVGIRNKEYGRQRIITDETYETNIKKRLFGNFLYKIPVSKRVYIDSDYNIYMNPYRYLFCW